MADNNTIIYFIWSMKFMLPLKQTLRISAATTVMNKTHFPNMANANCNVNFLCILKIWCRGKSNIYTCVWILRSKTFIGTLLSSNNCQWWQSHCHSVHSNINAYAHQFNLNLPWSLSISLQKRESWIFSQESVSSQCLNSFHRRCFN